MVIQLRIISFSALHFDNWYIITVVLLCAYRINRNFFICINITKCLVISNQTLSLTRTVIFLIRNDYNMCYYFASFSLASISACSSTYLLHNFLCIGQSASWHSREQKKSWRHRRQCNMPLRSTFPPGRHTLDSYKLPSWWWTWPLCIFRPSICRGCSF